MNSQAQLVWDSLEFRTPIILRIVEPLSENQMRWWPPNRSNSIAWLIWHIAEVEDNWIRDRLYGEPRRYPFGRSVQGTAHDEYPAKAALLSYFAEVRALTKQRLERMADEEFERFIHDSHWHDLREATMERGRHELRLARRTDRADESPHSPMIQ